MCQKPKFFKCRHCANLTLLVEDAHVPLYCCGEPMEELKPNTSEGAGEKHLPVVQVKDRCVQVSVGSVHHPMTEEHSIGWVCLHTEKGCQLRGLPTDQAPTAEFCLAADDKPIAAYAHCNLHGLWETKLE